MNALKVYTETNTLTNTHTNKSRKTTNKLIMARMFCINNKIILLDTTIIMWIIYNCNTK